MPTRTICMSAIRHDPSSERKSVQVGGKTVDRIGPGASRGFGPWLPWARARGNVRLPVQSALEGLPWGSRVPIRFSVFIPVYNDARWLGGAIDSVLAQTHEDWELVIGDNASERDLREIAGRYSDDRIRYHRWDTHTDYVDNHNRTINLCRFEWLQLLSADDRLHPECLAKMAARIEALAEEGTTPAMVLTGCRPVHEDGRPATFEFSGSWRIKRLPDGLYDGAAWLHHIAAPGQVPWNVGSLAVGRHVLEILGGFYRVEIGLSVDIEMALRVGAYGPVAYIDEPLLDYTVRAGGLNREVARKDRARARMTSHGSVLRSGLAVHEARREVSDAERRYVRRMIGQSFIGRALQHRYLPDGGGRRGALGNVARAFWHDPLWFLDLRQAVRGVGAIVAPRWMIVVVKDRFRRRRSTF